MLPPRILTGVAFAVILAGCQAGPSASVVPSATPVPAASAAASPTADEIVVTVSVTGGECPKGPCGAEYVVHRDGRIDGPDGARAIRADEVDLIAAEVGRTSWDLVRSVPFSGECPTAYDGQKRVYAFPASGGDVVLDSCEVDLSRAALFQAIDRALFGG